MNIKSIGIELWIEERFPEDSHWTDGNCYLFATILQAAFPGGDIVYDPIEGHFLYRYDHLFYDWHGEHEEPDVWYDWETYADTDYSHWRHVMRDCVGGAWRAALDEEEEQNRNLPDWC